MTCLMLESLQTTADERRHEVVFHLVGKHLNLTRVIAHVHYYGSYRLAQEKLKEDDPQREHICLQQETTQ